jgi:hypothetical protein
LTRSPLDATTLLRISVTLGKALCLKCINEQK